MRACVGGREVEVPGEITIIVSQYFTLAYMLKLNYLSVRKPPTLASSAFVSSHPLYP